MLRSLSHWLKYHLPLEKLYVVLLSAMLKTISDFPVPSRKLFRARESLVCDIPAGDKKTGNLFLQCV
jgi:hypothetical protein